MSQPRFNWPLAQDSFTFWDKLKIASWVLTTPQYTMGPRVAEFETKMGELANGLAVGVANGSAANQLVFELWKQNHPDQRATVIVPAVTWISSVTPAIMAGMEVVFCDVNREDFSFDYEVLEGLLKTHQGKPLIIWPTALIGFVPDMGRLRELATAYKAELYLDACENTLSCTDWDKSILSSADLVTTSCYFSHQITAVEFGFVFCQKWADYLNAKMLRNHGLARSLSKSWRAGIEQANPSVDPQFLFALGGTNLRPTDVHAMFGLQDIKRVEQYRVHRTEVYRAFYHGLDRTKYWLPEMTESHVGFCLPVFAREDGVIDAIKVKLNQLGIQTRPIIGGNLLRQPPFKAYGNPTDFPNAEWIHTHGAYIGLHSGVTLEMVQELVGVLNDL